MVGFRLRRLKETARIVPVAPPKEELSMRPVETLSRRLEAAARRAATGRAAAILLVLAACGLAGHGVGPVGAAESAAPGADAKAGEAVFAANCSACHADGGNLIDPKKPLRGSAKLKDFETFLGWIRVPVAPMPPFPAEQVSDAQATDLYRYVTTALGAPQQK
jgi:cytochrome c6